MHTSAMLERRRLPRTRIFAVAKAIARHPPWPYDCSVRNISALGACLEFRANNAIPSNFDLTFDRGRTLRECHVIWRTTSEVGIAFLDPQAAWWLPTRDANAPQGWSGANWRKETTVT